MLEPVLLHGDPPYLEVKAITRSQAIVSGTVVISQTQVSEPAIRVEVFPVVKDATFNSATVSPAYRLCTNKPLQILDRHEIAIVIKNLFLVRDTPHSTVEILAPQRGTRVGSFELQVEQAKDTRLWLYLFPWA